jgi:hypothetical protein
MAIQIGKYKRPGIFIEEFDNSIIQTPLVEGITNLVVGVSRKGPVNTPIRLNSVSDLEAVFGPIDRGLERKDSYFHRTVAKMLESSPVFAMNLLSTNDQLDTLEYQSISLSSDMLNDVERRAPFRRFHDTTGFWKRDTEAFLDIVRNNPGSTNRLLNITNISDKKATIFIIKSQSAGFDRTLLEWYGSRDKVPTYVNPLDWASDYLVDVVVVSGDWSDYRSLSLDQRWQRYFSADGLRKNFLREFINDRNVTTLGYYQALSLIPYFRDTNGRNIFIETVLNRDTDKTGVFCAFNTDLAETDFFNGKIDLVGHTIAAKNETNIDFLSYREDIVEELEYKSNPLDMPGNVTALMGTHSNLDHFFGSATNSFAKLDGVYGYQQEWGLPNSFHRTAWLGEGNVFGLGALNTTGYLSGLTYSATNINMVHFTSNIADTPQPYAIINNKYVPIRSSATFSFGVDNKYYPKLSYTASYYAAFSVSQDGELKPYFTKEIDKYPAVPSNEIVLSYMKIDINGGTFSTPISYPVTISPDTTAMNSVPTFDSNFIDLVAAPSGIGLTANSGYPGNGNTSITIATFSNGQPVVQTGFKYTIQGEAVEYTYLPASFYDKYDPTSLYKGGLNSTNNLYGEIEYTKTGQFIQDVRDKFKPGSFVRISFEREYYNGNPGYYFTVAQIASVTYTDQDPSKTCDLTIRLTSPVLCTPFYDASRTHSIALLKNTFDYSVDLVDNGSLKVNFFNTNIQTNDKMGFNFSQLRKIKMFNRLVSLLRSPNKNKMAMVLGPGLNGQENLKFPVKNLTITNVVTVDNLDKSFILNTGFSENMLPNVLNGFLCFYTEDNEMILGTGGIKSSAGGPSASFGIAGYQSKLYLDYYNGLINLKDYMYSNLVMGGATMSVSFFRGNDPSHVTGLNTGVTSSFAGYNYIMLSGNDSISNLLTSTIDEGDKISFKESSLNKSLLTITTSDQSSLFQKYEFTYNSANQKVETLSTLTSNVSIYRVDRFLTYEYLPIVKSIYNRNDAFTHYLKMYVTTDYALGTNDLNLEFKDAALNLSNLLLKDDNLFTNSNITANNTFWIYSQDSNYKQSLEVEIPEGYVRQPNKVLVDAQRYTEVVKGDWLDAFIDTSKLGSGEYPRRMTRIIDKKLYPRDRRLVELTCDSAINIVNLDGDLQTMRYKTVDSYVETYKAMALNGFKLRDASMPDGTEVRQNQILNVVAKGTPLFKALTNKEAIDFRYLIDSFGNGLTEKSKQQLVDICGERKDAFGFLNMPSIKDYKASVSPSFLNKDGVISAEFIAKGGDDSTGPLFQYSFGEGEGATCVGYFLPYLNISDNGRPMNVPPASYVATTYMKKHSSGLTGITPWTIAAGVTNGRIIGINDLEIDFTNEDIEWLNGAQMNPIVFKRNRGNVIETENTAQTIYKSALSYIHVREVLIELERELSRMLLDFQWQYNTADIRAEIKLRADLICETYVSRNGLYNYFNKMDEENNTNEIIDNQIGVLDTYVEPIKGMGIIVNNITILRTGAIAAGGFQ